MKYLLNILMFLGGIVYLTLMSVLVILSGVNFISPNILITVIWVAGLAALIATEYAFNKKHIFG